MSLSIIGLNKMITTTALSIIALLTSTISGTIGMGGGILLLSAMTFFLTIEVIVPVHGVVQLVSNSTRSFLLRDHFKKTLIFSFALGVPLGAGLSTYLITQITNKHYFYLAIALIILFALFRPKKVKFYLPERLFFIVGAIVGFLGLFINATRPFIAPFFLNEHFSKEEIVANKAAIQTIGHLVKIPAFIALGFAYQDHFHLIGTLVIASFIGTKLGVKLLGKINDVIFTKLFRAALVIAAFRLLFKFFHSL